MDLEVTDRVVMVPCPGCREDPLPQLVTGEEPIQAWCDTCKNRGHIFIKLCHHGNDPSECNDCLVESDLAYDMWREG